MITPASPLRYIATPWTMLWFEPALITMPASPVSRIEPPEKTFCEAPSSSTPPSLSSKGSLGMPWMVLFSSRWPLEYWMKICSPRLPPIVLLRTMLFSEPATRATPSSLSLIVLFWTVLPVRPLSASKSSTPAAALRRAVMSSTTTRVVPEVSCTP